MNWGEFFAYEPATGRLLCAVKRPGPNSPNVGDEVGSIKSDGRYRTVVLQGKRYYTHRIAWELLHGPIPQGYCIDHIDGNGLNNTAKNLRLVTLSENQRNRRISKLSRTGINGVTPHSRGGFHVQIAGQYLGYFKDIDKAAAARKAADAANGFHIRNQRTTQ